MCDEAFKHKFSLSEQRHDLLSASSSVFLLQHNGLFRALTSEHNSDSFICGSNRWVICHSYTMAFACNHHLWKYSSCFQRISRGNKRDTFEATTVNAQFLGYLAQIPGDDGGNHREMKLENSVLDLPDHIQSVRADASQDYG